MLSFRDRDVPLNASTQVSGGRRPIKAVVLHDTEGSSPIEARRGASWHWLIDRDGTIYRDVSEENCAHHVASTDEWRPPWVVPSPVPVSDVNFCAIGIELVSNQDFRNAGEPYTQAQYDSLRALAQDIESRHGPLPWVGHGQLQLDRTDPVAFDWARAGFGDPTDAGRHFQPDRVPPDPGGPRPDDSPDDSAEGGTTIMTDDEAIEIGKALWVNAVFDAALGIPRAWAHALTKGVYWGTPQSTEIDAPNGKKVQRFEFGLAVWLGGDRVHFAFAKEE
jgi:hypothetical protein